MAPIFSQIVYIRGAEAFGGAIQMAIDEVLLSECRSAIFRDYQWSEPTTSIGYFGSCSDLLTIESTERTSCLVRRPTGGGLVEHGHGRDFTYSVISPAGGQELRARESYRAIHGCLAEVLRSFGLSARLAGEADSGDGSQACFMNPVGDDLMLGGKKIAGAGQKRSRGALLHQGSVQPIEVPDGLGEAIAGALAERVTVIELGSEVLAEAEKLAVDKYESEAWTRRR